MTAWADAICSSDLDGGDYEPEEEPMTQELMERADAPIAPATTEAQGLVLMFERLAKDPAVDVDKLERLIQMQERIMKHQAKSAFDAAFAAMQAAIPQIDEKSKVIVKGTLRSTYASLEDIHEAIKPVLTQHGMSIRHRTEWPADRPKVIRIVGILSHVQGHSEESSFEAPMDQSEFRSDIQSMASTVSYGRRYTTLDLLNIATRHADNDGNKIGEKVPPPDGYDAWMKDMALVAERGMNLLEEAFHKAKKEYRLHLTKNDALAWAGLKKKAGAL